MLDSHTQDDGFSIPTLKLCQKVKGQSEMERSDRYSTFICLKYCAPLITLKLPPCATGMFMTTLHSSSYKEKQSERKVCQSKGKLCFFLLFYLKFTCIKVFISTVSGELVTWQLGKSSNTKPFSRHKHCVKHFFCFEHRMVRDCWSKNNFPIKSTDELRVTKQLLNDLIHPQQDDQWFTVQCLLCLNLSESRTSGNPPEKNVTQPEEHTCFYCGVWNTNTHL